MTGTVVPTPQGGRTPAVSVCIPVYRGEDHLATTMESVLAQTFDDFELVVLDNCSPDRSAEIAASFDDPRIRLESTPRVLPLTENWTTAVRATRAPLVKLLCDDDLLHPRCLELQVAALQHEPDLALVVSRHHLVDGDGHLVVPARFLRGLLGRRTHAEVVRRVVRSGANPIGPMCGVTFRRAAFDATEGFVSDKIFIADLDLLVAMSAHGAFRGQRESLAAYRLVPTSVIARARREHFRVQEAFMTELRASPGSPVRRVDALTGHLAAPWARARRRAGSALAERRGA
ncbi:glycosyltransferase family 2 protein [Actinomycetospora termitidis]|uniref:Glycosyltransferase family 2 protein n=1 Tax=Actinomycetospora termitidis TaxID=3053470 RepID=A0ABT7MHI1_9PSEU|nr:glycosyltransferase family 2 protein [Actinomycetospora sp. Odt1-22]MDL5160134.1 glycosyltransferase family 2 protein [Actinomycetospora sp. Odt1-22]